MKKRPSVSDPSALVGLHFITINLPMLAAAGCQMLEAIQ
jgi:hypothetical protein